MPCLRASRTRPPTAPTAPRLRSARSIPVLRSSFLRLDVFRTRIWRLMVTPGVVRSEGGQGERAKDAAGHAQDATGNDRESDARQRCDDAGFKVTQRGPD